MTTFVYMCEPKTVKAKYSTRKMSYAGKRRKSKREGGSAGDRYHTATMTKGG